MYIGTLDDIVNSTYHSTIKMKRVHVKSSTYIDSSKEKNKKDPKFKIADLVRISNIKILLQKVTLQIGLKTVFWLKKLKNILLWIYVINDLNSEEIDWNCYEKDLQKINQKKFRI